MPFVVVMVDSRDDFVHIANEQIGLQRMQRSAGGRSLQGQTTDARDSRPALYAEGKPQQRFELREIERLIGEFAPSPPRLQYTFKLTVASGFRESHSLRSRIFFAPRRERLFSCQLTKSGKVLRVALGISHILCGEMKVTGGGAPGFPAAPGIACSSGPVDGRLQERRLLQTPETIPEVVWFFVGEFRAHFSEGTRLVAESEEITDERGAGHALSLPIVLVDENRAEPVADQEGGSAIAWRFVIVRLSRKSVPLIRHFLIELRLRRQPALILRRASCKFSATLVELFDFSLEDLFLFSGRGHALGFEFIANFLQLGFHGFQRNLWHSILRNPRVAFSFGLE